MTTARVKTEIQPVAWGPVLAALVVGAAFAGWLAWRMTLQGLESRMTAKRSAIRKLALSGGIPPNQEVADYLASRQVAVEARYQYWLAAAAAPALPTDAQADPQLYFQERLHDLQQTFQRLAAARAAPVPEQLGFPKELPPSDTVPRLLIQLTLVEEMAELIYEHQVTALTSLRIEDPETVSGEEDAAPFLMRLPVRLRFSASLAQLMKLLSAIERQRPLVDVRGVHIASAPEGGALELELTVARYLALSTAVPDVAAEAEATAVKKKPARKSKAKPAARASENE